MPMHVQLRNTPSNAALIMAAMKSKQGSTAVASAGQRVSQK